MEIDKTSVANDSVYFIAEGGVNHDGSVSQAKELIEIAAESGADAVKFQTFDPDELVTKDASKAAYQQEQTEHDESQFDMLKTLRLNSTDHRRLFDHAQDLGITFLSTPMDQQSVDILERIGVPAIKVGSGDLTNKPLLEYIARLGRPMIVSTGMATLEEVENALGWIRSTDPNSDVAMLHCTSSYPAKMEDVNLRVINTLRQELKIPIGYSDHTIEIETPALAVAAEAVIVEKHFTVDKSLPGPDHQASLDPSELAEAVDLAREAAVARGRAVKEPTSAEEENIPMVRKSIHTTANVTEGERYTARNVAVKRPASGLSPSRLGKVIGARCTRNLDADEPVTEDAVEGISDEE